jgi:ABC-type multidrug transport system ATPase subunit
MPVDGLVAEGLVKRYGEVTALNDFSLTVAQSEIVGLVGANGSGKTTFVEAVSGLIRLDGGHVEVLGIDVRQRQRAARSMIGFAPQEISLYFSATVQENLRLFGGLAGLRREALRRSIDQVTGEMQLEGLLDRRVGVLSGGQMRRVQVASVLAAAPRLLLLDEPTAGADPPTRQALLAAVRNRAAAGAAIVYTTHYLPELADLDATLAVVKAGKVIARGTQQALLSGLLGEVRVQFEGSIPDRLRDHCQVADGELRMPAADPAKALAGMLADGVVPVSVDVRRPGLDDLYASLGV